MSQDAPTPRKTSLNVLDVWECESVVSGGGSGVQLVDTCDQEVSLSLEASRNLSSTWTVIDDCQFITYDQDRRQLCNLLWELRPHWTPKDLVAVVNKLANVGICSIAALTDALAGDLNQRLRHSDQPAFLPGTIAELKRHVGVACTRAELASAAREAANRQTSPPKCPRKRQLCNALWESRPNWSPEALLAAERKLAGVGIVTIDAFDSGLADDLNERLRRGGQKAFSAEAITAFKCHRFDRSQNAAEEECDQDRARETLRGVLTQSRPLWTLQDVIKAEDKLASVGVISVETLVEALPRNLNKRLRCAGLKTFSPNTIGELCSHLGLPCASGN